MLYGACVFVFGSMCLVAEITIVRTTGEQLPRAFYVLLETNVRYVPPVDT